VLSAQTISIHNAQQLLFLQSIAVIQADGVVFHGVEGHRPDDYVLYPGSGVTHRDRREHTAARNRICRAAGAR
jgi:hypothetical protein